MALPRTTRPLTAKDIRDWPDDDELYDGVPRSVAAAPGVSAIDLRIGALLDVFVSSRELGVPFGADASFRLSRARDGGRELVHLPDAAFVTADRAGEPGALRASPDEGDLLAS